VAVGDPGAAIRGEAAITNNLQLVSKLLGVLVNVHETRHQHILTTLITCGWARCCCALWPRSPKRGLP